MQYQFTSQYFDSERSMAHRAGASIPDALSAIAARYIGQNPPTPFQFRAFDVNGFFAREDGRFDLNLSRKWPDAKAEQLCYVCARFYKEETGTQKMRVSCYGPARIHVNGESIFRSGVQEEVNVKVERLVDMPFRAGWNSVVIRVKKVASGFGCLFGPYEARQRWITFLAPFRERAGQAGFAYSQPVDADQPEWDLAAPEADTGLSWYPAQRWGQHNPFAALHGADALGYVVGWTGLDLDADRDCVLTRKDAPPDLEVYVDRTPVEFRGDRATVSLGAGKHDVEVVRHCTGNAFWGWSLEAADPDGAPIPFSLPRQVHGARDPWLYLGVLDERPTEPLTLDGLFGGDAPCYWQLSAPGMAVRPYLENQLFGRWNYPLGVTLYGLLKTARQLGRPDIEDYAQRHIETCVRMHEYSLWDEDAYGFPEINAKLSHLRMLDDCGSFGSAMLEAAEGAPNAEALAVADRIARHMSHEQERRSDCAFYRRLKGYFMEDTLWVDDLYMSTPFLLRYAQITGDKRYLDDAARQFLLYKGYLFMEDRAVMSHVYDFKYNTATRMPWGRGNGWCLFSLSELLEALPDDHPDRAELLALFNALCRGYAALQAPSGLWHQLLTHPDAYEESSCTAMFVYAFCRGLRLGFVEPALRPVLDRAARRGWRALMEKAVDCEGNIYGICGGSCYSFSPEYYTHELGWIINDPHGTGIVMLAGIEMMNWSGR